MEFLKYYVWSFGYASELPLMSKRGIASMCGLAFGIFVMFSGLRMMLRYRNLSEKEKMVTLLAVSCILLNAFILSYVEGGEIQYYQAIMPMGMILVVLEIITENFTFEKFRVVAVNLALMILLISSIGTILNEKDSNAWPSHSNASQPSLYPVVRKLCEMEYSQGISTFWLANLITELSDGEIEMWHIAEASSKEFYEWMQLRNHIGSFPSDRYFVIEKADSDFAPNEFGVLNGRNQNLQCVYRDDYYVVYGN